MNVNKIAVAECFSVVVSQVHGVWGSPNIFLSQLMKVQFFNDLE